MLTATLLALCPQLPPFQSSGRAADAEPEILRLAVDPRAPETWLDAVRRAAPGRDLGPLARSFGGLQGTHHAAGSTPEGDGPGRPTFTPDGARILVPHRHSRNLIEWDVASGDFLRSIPLSGAPLDVAVTPDGLRALTANGAEDTLSFVDLVSGSESGTLALGEQPAVVAIRPDGTRAAVGNTGDGTISMVDLGTGLELYRLGGFSYSMLLSINFESGAVVPHTVPFVFAGNTRLVHADPFADRLAILDVATGVVTSVTTPAGPQAVAISAAGTTAVVQCSTGRALAVVDLTTGTLTKTIALGVDVFGGGIAIDAGATKAVVSVLNAVKVVNLVTNAVGPNLPTIAEEIHRTADGLHAFCVGRNGSLISFATGAIVRNLNGLSTLSSGAVSPLAPRAVGVGALFNEDLLVFDTSGASGSLLRRHASGPGPEGDSARSLDLSPDGAKLAVAQLASGTLSLLEAETGTLLWHVQSGERPAECAFTPDGRTVVGTNLDSDFVSVVDVASGLEDEVPITLRAHQVELSPDSRFAYVLTAVGDGVWRIDLPTRSVSGPQLPTGDTGSIGFLYQQTSGMTLSHDGATLAVCGSFTNVLTLIDTASWSVVASVPVAGFPVRAIFDARDENVLVSARDADAVRVVRNLGPGSFVATSYATGDQPFELALTLDSERLFVGNFGTSNVRVIRTATGTTLRNIPFSDYLGGLALSADGAELYLATGTWSVSIGPGPLFSQASSGRLLAFDARTYAARGVLETGFCPAGLALAPVARTAAVPSPALDGHTHYRLPLRRGPQAR